MTDRLLVGEHAQKAKRGISVSRWFKRLLHPTVAQNIEDQRRLELLLPLLCGLAPLILVGAYFVTEPGLSTFLILTVAALLVSMWLAHTRYYRISLVIVVVAIALTPFGGVLLQSRFEQSDVTAIFTFIFPALVLGQIFFSLRELVVLILAVLGGVLVMALAVPELPLANTIGAFGIIVPTAALLLTAIAYRNNLERERLQQLEALVDRSTELATEAVEASRLKSELLAKVSHELRTPLGAILGTTQLLESGTFGELSSRQHELSGRIVKRTRELSHLVEDLLDQSQFEKGMLSLSQTQFTPSQLITNCDQLMRGQATAKGLGFLTELDPAMPEFISNDLNRLNQVANNLLGNAIKFTNHGFVKLRIARHSPTEWLLEVSDSGVGIPEAARSAIFEPFRQGDFSIRREKSGVGLGLAIVKQIVILMGGHIQFQSEVERGTVFQVILPFNLPDEQFERPKEQAT